MCMDAHMFAAHMREYLHSNGVDTEGVSNLEVGANAARILKKVAEEMANTKEGEAGRHRS
jgi:hypothetical protein